MENLKLKPIAILGAGSWGTALALYLARRQQSIRLWSIEKTEIDALLKDKANNRFLPGFDLPDFISPIADLPSAIKGVEEILIVVPSQGFRDTLQLLKPLLTKPTLIISATKGLDENGKLLHELVSEVLGNKHHFAVLSGPSFAREVAAGLPAAVTIASKKPNLANKLQHRFDSELLRIQFSRDVIGVEIGGVVKNIIAIAIGIVDGIGMGANARSTLITYGLAEMMHLGVALGAKADTFMGLSGVGDLILTCMDDQSRNRRLGLALGRGQTIAEAEKAIGQAIEGKRNVEIIAKLAEKHKVKVPICNTVLAILLGGIDAEAGMKQIFATIEL